MREGTFQKPEETRGSDPWYSVAKNVVCWGEKRLSVIWQLVALDCCTPSGMGGVWLQWCICSILIFSLHLIVQCHFTISEVKTTYIS